MPSRTGRRGVLAALLALVFVQAALVMAAAAQDGDVRMPRYPCLSPDGSRIAFSYQGDLWIVAREGGEATRLTAHPAYESFPRWSPDGRWIAFASDREGNDDIFVIPVAGGDVRRLTFNSAQDVPAGWTPDSRAVLFRSWRHTSDGDNPGIFLVPLGGGTPLPVMPAGGHAPAVAPDARRIAFTRGSVDVWRRGYTGNGRHRLWLCDFDAPLLAVDGDGGGATPGFAGTPPAGGARAAQDLCTPMGVQAAATLRPDARYTKLDIDGRDPLWFPDGEHLLFLSETDGVANLEILAPGSGARVALTRFSEGRLRYPALAADGSWAAAEYEDGIIVVQVPRELLAADALGAAPAQRAPRPAPSRAALPEPRRVAIRVPADAKAPETEWVKVTGGAEDFALSMNGKQIAFVARGEVFVMKASTTEPTATDVSGSQAREAGVAWLPDSSGLIFASDRAGGLDLYRVRSTDPGEPRLARALRTEITRLTDDPREEMSPRVSPDGKRIAFQRGPFALAVADADGRNVKVIAEGMVADDYAWSPDSRWLAYSMDDDDFNSDIYIAAADGTVPPVNISRHPDSDSGPAWSANGKVLAFTSTRAFLNQTDIWYVWLTREDEERSRAERLDELSGDRPKAATGAKAGSDERTDARQDAQQGAKQDAKQGTKQDAKDDAKSDAKPAAKPKEVTPVRIDFEDIHKRLHRLTSFPGTETQVLVSRDASEFVFTGDTDGKHDLWKVKWDGSDPVRLTQGGQDPQGARWDSTGAQIFFLKGGGSIASVPLAGGEVKAYGFDAQLMIDRAAQRGFVFDEGWRRLNDRFYDEHFHGCDWRAMHDRYRPWALTASTYRDFQDVFRMMMGELNASHLGIWDGPGDPNIRGGALDAQTGELGVLFDASDRGPGLRIARVIKGTPAERVDSPLAPGERILAVEGVTLAAGDDFARLLDHTVDRPTRIEVQGNEGKRREVILRPISGQQFRDRLYEEEIALRQHCVAQATGGRVAYIHVRSMDETSLELFERDLYAEAHGRDALILDVRNNGGGWTTDLLLTSLTAPDHAITQARGAGPGYPSDRRLLYAWTKPIVVLCDENSFSNAEIFSWAIRTIKRGPVVGQQTFGGVISTGGTRLLDGSFLRLPFRGWRSKLDGSNLEGTGCMPDIVVENLPGDLARGLDRQLERGIAEALRQIAR
jgi:tricorn protease